jgi:hypothetical protein
MDFNAPQGPENMVFPHTAHIWADAVIGAVAIVLFVLAAIEFRRTGSPLGLLLLIGGGIALLNEPVDDILGLVWHPRPGQNTVLNTIGPVPLWGLPTYIIFFGGIPWLLLRELRRCRFTIRKFWIGVGLTFVADLLIEVPLLQTDLYTYYSHGDVPMAIAGFPVYWLFINTTGPILCAAILFQASDYFTGWRTPLVLLLPLAADAACSIVVGLPVYSALHTPETTALLRWGGALLSCGIGLVIFDAESKWIMARTRALQKDQSISAGASRRKASSGRTLAEATT